MKIYIGLSSSKVFLNMHQILFSVYAKTIYWACKRTVHYTIQRAPEKSKP